MVLKALNLLVTFVAVAILTVLWLSPARGADLSGGANDPQAARDARSAVALSQTSSTTTVTKTFAEVYHASAKTRRPFLLFVAGVPVRAVRGLAHAVVPHHNGKSHRHVVVAVPNASGDGFVGYELPEAASDATIVAVAFRETREPPRITPMRYASMPSVSMFQPVMMSGGNCPSGRCPAPTAFRR